MLLAGDIHGDLRWLLNLLWYARRFGCEGIVPLGDTGLWLDNALQRRTGENRINDPWLDAVETMLDGFGLWMRFLDGNHDNHPDARAAYPELGDDSGIRPIRERIDWADRASVWDWCGVRFGALGGAYSVDSGRRREGFDWWPTEQISYREADRMAGRGHVDVLLTHDDPEEARIPRLRPLDMKSDDRSSAHRRIISMAVEAATPELLCHGHFHIRYSDVVGRGDDRTRVEGLASNRERNGGSWGILELPSLRFTDGWAVLAGQL